MIFELEKGPISEVYVVKFSLYSKLVLVTIPPWEVVGTLYLASSYVTFKYFAFLSVCDQFESLGHV